MAAEFGVQNNAVTFMVSAGLVFEIVAAMCSSPQTAQINAEARADTLMLWVKIGLVTSGAFVAVAVFLDRDRWPSIAGGALAGAILWLAYDYALKAGLSSGGPGTESY